MVSYVLLIAITISLSIMVYTWLRFFAGAENAPECPEGVNLVISAYNCSDGPNGFVNVTLKNNGRFTIRDFVLRINTRPDAEFGIYELNSSRNNVPIAPGESKTSRYFLNETGDSIDQIKLIDVQPLIEQDGESIFCRSFSKQKVSCQ